MSELVQPIRPGLEREDIAYRSVGKEVSVMVPVPPAIEPGHAPGCFLFRAYDIEGRMLAEFPNRRGRPTTVAAQGTLAKGPLVIAVYDGDSGRRVPHFAVTEFAGELFEFSAKTAQP